MSEVVLKVAMACEVRWAGATPACQPAAAGTLGALPPPTALTIGTTRVTAQRHTWYAPANVPGFPTSLPPWLRVVAGLRGRGEAGGREARGRAVGGHRPARSEGEAAVQTSRCCAGIPTNSWGHRPARAGGGKRCRLPGGCRAAGSLALSRAARTPRSGQAAALLTPDPHVCFRCLLLGRSL